MDGKEKESNKFLFVIPFDDFEAFFREPEKVGGAVTLDSGRRPEKNL